MALTRPILLLSLSALTFGRVLDRPNLHSTVRHKHHAGLAPEGSVAPTVEALRLRGGEVAAPTASQPGVFGAIVAQIAKEIANCNTSPAKFYGFVGACCNWFLGFSAVYDATRMGPEVIALPMTLAMIMYSCLFGRWAGWDVTPRNFILSGSHIFNVLAQSNQLRRVLQYKLGLGAKEEVMALATKSAGFAIAVAAFTLLAPKLKAAMPEGSYLASAGGPFTIHPWPPVTKLFLSAASLTDLFKSTDKISLTQYAALTLTGAIFSQYGLVVTPINYPLTAVNILLFLSSGWHLGRKVKADFL